MRNLTWTKAVIAVDVDGVLADQVPHVLERAEKEFGVRMVKADVTKWNTMVGNTPFDKLIARYLKDPEWVKAMPVIDGAREGFAALEKFGEVMIATSIPDDAEKPRIEWLEKNFGFTGRLINTMKTGKAGIPAHMLVDDYPPNIAAFISAPSNLPNNDPFTYSPFPRYAILLKQPWNVQDAEQFADNKSPVTVAENWAEVRDWALNTISFNLRLITARNAKERVGVLLNDE